VTGRGALRVLVYTLVFFCCFFTLFNLVRLSRRSSKPTETIVREDYYNKSIPDIKLVSIDDRNIELFQFKHKTLIVKFTKFLDGEINYLIYLDYLAQRYRDRLSLLLFYNSNRAAESQYIFRHSDFHAPIVKANDLIGQVFGAKGNETIILDHELRIKFKSSANSKKLLYSQVSKYAGIEDSQVCLPDGDLSYIDPYRNELVSIQSASQQKVLFINVCIAPCAECSDAKRNDMQKGLLLTYPEKLEIFYLFGADNDPLFLEEYKEKHQLFGPQIHFGLLAPAEGQQPSEYFEMFNYQNDPFLLVMKDGDKGAFIENLDNSGTIDVDFLAGFLK